MMSGYAQIHDVSHAYVFCHCMYFVWIFWTGGTSKVNPTYLVGPMKMAAPDELRQFSCSFPSFFATVAKDLVQWLVY